MKKKDTRGGSTDRWLRGIQRHYPRMHRQIQQWQANLQLNLVKDVEGQQEELLQVHWEQKEDVRKCGLAAEWDTEPGAKGHGKGRGNQWLPQFLLIRLAFSHTTSLRPMGKSGARKISHRWRKTRLENVKTNWTHTRPWDLLGYNHQCRESCLTDHSPLSLKGCGHQGKFLSTGRKQMSLLSSERARRRIRVPNDKNQHSLTETKHPLIKLVHVNPRNSPVTLTVV